MEGTRRKPIRYLLILGEVWGGTRGARGVQDRSKQKGRKKEKASVNKGGRRSTFGDS